MMMMMMMMRGADKTPTDTVATKTSEMNIVFMKFEKKNTWGLVEHRSVDEW